MSRTQRCRADRLLAGVASCCLAVALPAVARAQAVNLGDTTGGGGGGGAASAGPGGGLAPSVAPQPGGIGVPATNPFGASTPTLNERLGNALGLPFASSPGTPAVQVTPAINLEQGWTNNVFATPGFKPESAFFTIINPSLTVAADTQRLQLSASYAPDFYIYEPPRGQNFIAQNLAAQAHVIVVPDAVFVDVSAFAGLQTISGGYGPPGTVLGNQVNSSQDYGFSLSPYLLRQIGDLGTLQVGGLIGETAQVVPGGIVVAAAPGLPPQTVASENMTTTEEFASFTSGDATQRLQSTISAMASQSYGTGVNGGAYQDTVSYQAAYAITHSFSLLGTVGWQDLHYGGVPPVNISGLLWNVGFSYTPSADSNITVRYGRTDGLESAYVSASYNPTPRTQLTANYSRTVTTDLQQLLGGLGGIAPTPGGGAISTQTGLPFLLGNNFVGINSAVYVYGSAVATAALQLDRDSFQASVNSQTETPLNAAAAGAFAFKNVDTYGTLSWAHDLSPVIQTTASVQYGVMQASGGGFSQQSTVLVGTAQVTYALSATLSANLQYSHTVDNFSHPPLPGFAADVILVGVQKTF